MQSSSFYNGQLLIAMPGIGDPRFEQAVIYICAHSEEGAMGLVINHTAQDISLLGLLEKLDIIDAGKEHIHLPPGLSASPVMIGGPVEPGRGFVLHTTDYFQADGTLPVDESVGLTATLDILQAMVRGEGPRHFLLALGYAGWGPGQLEAEIAHNAWLTSAADERLLFVTEPEKRYGRALRAIGIDPAQLSSDAGHA